eukprot:scaffold12688_cov146-Isochrysis_galbana.AAC.7
MSRSSPLGLAADGSGRTPTVGVPQCRMCACVVIVVVVCACVPSSDALPSGGRAARSERWSVAGPGVVCMLP